MIKSHLTPRPAMPSVGLGQPSTPRRCGRPGDVSRA